MGKKLYNTAESDNTNVQKPIIIERLLYTPSLEVIDKAAKLGYYWNDTFKVWDNLGLILQGKSSEKTLKTTPEDYLHWWRGSKDRRETSMSNGTHPYIGIKRTILPAIEGTLLLSGMPSLLNLKNIWKFAKMLPHGISNLATNLALQTGAGVAGSTAGYHVDRELGGTGEIGSLVGGLGSIYGLNKTLFMRDFNVAITRPFNREYQNALQRGWVHDEGDDIFTFNRLKKSRKDRKISIGSSDSDVAQVYKWDDKIAHEIHLGGDKDGAPSREDLVWAYREFNKMPPGTYITPDATATNRVMRILNNGVLNELITPKKYEPLFNPPTVDGFTTAIKMGNKNLLLWADNTYLTRFHDQIQKTDNKPLYDAYHNFINNKTLTNLEALNKVLIEMGAKPATFINNELRIPFPIIFKP